MAMVEGIKGFGVRHEDGWLTPAYPYVQDASDTAAIYNGTPLALTSGLNFKRATVSGTTVISSKLLGFSAYTDPDPDFQTYYPGAFQSFGILKDQFGRDRFGVYRAEQINVFTMCLKSGIIASEQYIGTTCDLVLASGLLNTFVVDPTSNVAGLVQIVGIDPRDYGLSGGRVDVRVPDAKSSFLTGP